ncbi:hypothetical protein NLJ89_g12107 [Agrocybe chaxingu]|uniref:Uncharacterized protein n=1 Tax=Agrocybe chaxingu TaxID=84603 RepID=A0A9W8JMH4_9AGAR|nr:hypothetical protein NLJ89_g12107 [Agrocybe chaxingu]
MRDILYAFGQEPVPDPSPAARPLHAEERLHRKPLRPGRPPAIKKSNKVLEVVDSDVEVSEVRPAPTVIRLPPAATSKPAPKPRKPAATTSNAAPTTSNRAAPVRSIDNPYGCALMTPWKPPANAAANEPPRASSSTTVHPVEIDGTHKRKGSEDSSKDAKRKRSIMASIREFDASDTSEIQNVINYCESRFRTALAAIEKRDRRLQPWMLEVLRQELGVALQWIGSATATGRLVVVPFIIRSLASSMCFRTATPAFDFGLLLALDGGADPNDPIDSHPFAWWRDDERPEANAFLTDVNLQTCLDAWNAARPRPIAEEARKMHAPADTGCTQCAGHGGLERGDKGAPSSHRAAGAAPPEPAPKATPTPSDAIRIAQSPMPWAKKATTKA